jgi:hypothetical protein
MTTLLIYQEPVALDRKEHRNLRLKKMDSLSFIQGLNSVPVAGKEFFEASRELPVVFIKDKDGLFVPIALLSLQPKGNKLGDDWGGIYMPAFIRRYPFVLANGKVVFDKQAPELQETAGEPLFKEDGENSDFLNKIIEFLGFMDAQFKLTHDYCHACVQHDLFTPFKVQVNLGNDKAMRLDSLYIIDEKKLNKLPDEQITDWFHKGWLAWSFAHLHSLGAVSRLAKREREAAPSQVRRAADA